MLNLVEQFNIRVITVWHLQANRLVCMFVLVEKVGKICRMQRVPPPRPHHDSLPHLDLTQSFLFLFLQPVTLDFVGAVSVFRQPNVLSLIPTDCLQKYQLDRVSLHDSKRATYEHTQKCAENYMLLGQTDRAVQLLLETEAENDSYYIDSLRYEEQLSKNQWSLSVSWPVGQSVIQPISQSNQLKNNEKRSKT